MDQHYLFYLSFFFCLKRKHIITLTWRWTIFFTNSFFSFCIFLGWKYLSLAMMSVTTAMLCKEQGITVTGVCAIYEVFVAQKVSNFLSIFLKFFLQVFQIWERYIFHSKSQKFKLYFHQRIFFKRIHLIYCPEYLLSVNIEIVTIANDHLTKKKWKS